ncbi:unnamed protein product [Mytilus coruscus]|uniref:Ig-like domain-containing protein n=1 Tax=Mytilus coruscus TaxID=42192 RepID=A0A6J8ASB2_MYTCO|nr:unnamed protein product [Mytilus coruscus]
MKITLTDETKKMKKICTESNILQNWFVNTSPAIFYKTVELFCKVNGHLNTSTTRKWERDHFILTSKNKSIDSTKYRERLTVNGFALQIMNFQYSDLNKEYFCVYGFNKRHSNLTINMANFEMHPVNETVTRTCHVTAGILKVLIQFSLVYPIPRCKALYNEKFLAKSIKIRPHHDGVFYSTNVTIEESIGSMCLKTLKISCTVGSTDFVIMDFSTCSDHTKNCKNFGRRKVFGAKHALEGFQHEW